jgi:hypothetical protein
MRPDRRANALDDFRRTVNEMIPEAEKLMFLAGRLAVLIVWGAVRRDHASPGRKTALQSMVKLR